MFWICVFTFDFNSSLLAPMKSTGIREVGQYTMRGSAIPFKRFIQLTSRNTKDSGGVCRRIKNKNNDWDVFYSFGAINPNSSRTQIFYYTKELCTQDNSIYTGFSVTMKYEKDSNIANIFVHQNNYTAKSPKKEPECSLKLDYSNMQTKFKISYDSGNILLQVGEANKEMKNCSSFYYNLTGGYFSIYSTTEGDAENNNLQSFVYTPHSPEIPNPKETEEESKNRQTLSKSKKHRADKNLRRIRQKWIHYYRDQMEFESEILNGGTPNSVQLKRALKEIKELTFRASEGLNINELKAFIEETVQDKMHAALQKLQNSANDIIEFKSTFNDIYTSTTNLLKEISMETRIEMSQTINEFNQQIEDIFRNGYNRISDLSDSVDQNGQHLSSTILTIISIVEFAAYIAFFMHKRRKTKGFLKAD